MILGAENGEEQESWGLAVQNEISYRENMDLSQKHTIEVKLQVS